MKYEEFGKDLEGKEIQEALEELEDSIEYWKEEISDGNKNKARQELRFLEKEMEILEEFIEDIEGYAGLLRYANLLSEETLKSQIISEIKEESWFESLPSYISSNIDWDGIFEDLRGDYTVIEYKDQTFYVR